MSKKHWKQSSTYQILFGDEIVPGYVPFYYRAYLMFLKLRRSLTHRRSNIGEAAILFVDRIDDTARTLALGTRQEPLINKTYSHIEADLKTDKCRAITNEIAALKDDLHAKGLRFTSAAGSFKSKDFIPAKERNKLWENVWVLAHAGAKKGDAILDLGGASAILSYYLASMGSPVVCVDNDWGCHGIVYNARFVAKRMRWPLKVYNRDLALTLPFDDNSFDKVFCVCVLEHLTSEVRRNVMKEISRVLKTGGVAAFTFDYDARRHDARFDKGIRYALGDRLKNDILGPSVLSVMGNQTLTDDCPADFFLGTMFLKK
jgi:SAM-dependent methyltransferase